MRILLFASAFLLAGCEGPQIFHTDQSLRGERFEVCMGLLPAGPTSTKYNDWDEVVRACDSVAYSQSQRCVENCRFLPTPTPTEAADREQR